MICSNSLYGVVARIAVAEDLGLKILKLAFQVFNNFSLFYNVVMNETDIKQPFFFFLYWKGKQRCIRKEQWLATSSCKRALTVLCHVRPVKLFLQLDF